MHIADGVLSLPVAGAGFAIAVAGTALGTRKLREEKIPAAAALTAAFFVISLIQVPCGPVSVHLILNGLMGILLGWVAFPAILVGLTLQAFFFGFGGWSSLGTNVVDLALPAVICHYLFCRVARGLPPGPALFWVGFAAGALAIVLAALSMGAMLWVSGEATRQVGAVAALVHAPVALVEGVLTGAVAVYLKKVRPELFNVLMERTK